MKGTSMRILVVAEHDNITLKACTRNTLTAALKLGAAVDILVAGYNCQPVAQAAASLVGVCTVKLANAAHLAEGFAENLAAQVVSLAAGYSHILAPASTYGKNFLPRVAALLDVAQISEISAVVDTNTFVRPIYAGNALATVESRDAVKVITVRPTAFDAACDGGCAAI